MHGRPRHELALSATQYTMSSRKGNERLRPMYVDALLGKRVKKWEATSDDFD